MEFVLLYLNLKPHQINGQLYSEQRNNGSHSQIILNNKTIYMVLKDLYKNIAAVRVSWAFNVNDIYLLDRDRFKEPVHCLCFVLQ